MVAIYLPLTWRFCLAGEHRSAIIERVRKVVA
jgi:hypothetical protein